jgi:DNA-binding transcriptional ArsR family regulator
MAQSEKIFPETAARENYVKVQYEFVEFLSAQLIDFRKIFHGDLDELLVFMMISRFYLRDELRQRQESDPEGAFRASPTPSRIAELTGIPRETVRRKLKKLEEAGLLIRTVDGGWRVAVEGGQPTIRIRFEEFLQKEMSRVARFARAVAPFVA